MRVFSREVVAECSFGPCRSAVNPPSIFAEIERYQNYVVKTDRLLLNLHVYDVLFDIVCI